METTIGVSRSSGTVTEGDLAPLPHQEAQDHSLERKFDVSLSRNSEHPDGVARQGGTEVSLEIRTQRTAAGL